jgi:hypothetical protein
MPTEKIAIEPLQKSTGKCHKFIGVQHNNIAWDLTHLDSFVYRVDPGLGFVIDIVVFFSCHCFTRSISNREIFGAYKDENIYDDGREIRALDSERYQLSKMYLPRLMSELPNRTIQVIAGANFVTFEELDQLVPIERYAVFFEVSRDQLRKKRLLLRVQSAYRIDSLSHRQQMAKKVKFKTLLKAAYEGRPIRR